MYNHTILAGVRQLLIISILYKNQYVKERKLWELYVSQRSSTTLTESYRLIAAPLPPLLYQAIVRHGF
jgi:hypothetical protein